MTHPLFWAAGAALLVLLLLVGYVLWLDEAARDYDRTLGADRLPRGAKAWMAPLRGLPRLGRRRRDPIPLPPARVDLTERKTRKR